MADDTNIDDTTSGSQVQDGQPLVQPLPEDNATPSGDPTDPIQDATADVDVRQQQGIIDPSHPATDNASDIDQHQKYDEGLAGAAEASEPNAGNTVVDYNPEQDARNQQT